MEEKLIMRLFIYLQYKDIPHTRFEKEIGLSNGYLNTQLKRKSDLGESIIRKIIDNCLDMDIVWFITGRGEMLITTKPQIFEDTVPMHIYKETRDKMIEYSQEAAVLKQRNQDLEKDLAVFQEREKGLMSLNDQEMETKKEKEISPSIMSRLPSGGASSSRSVRSQKP